MRLMLKLQILQDKYTKFIPKRNVIERSRVLKCCFVVISSFSESRYRSREMEKERTLKQKLLKCSCPRFGYLKKIQTLFVSMNLDKFIIKRSTLGRRLPIMQMQL